jgi:diadenosine tetraphosphate (Ap4A) HIT family hydrolase
MAKKKAVKKKAPVKKAVKKKAPVKKAVKKKAPVKKAVKKKAPTHKATVTTKKKGKKRPFKPKAGMDLYKNSHFLFVHFGMPGNVRKMDTDQVDFTFHTVVAAPKKKVLQPSKVDKDMLRLQRELLKSPELEAVRAHDQKTRIHLYSFTLRSPLNKGGIYLIPVSLTGQVREYLQERKEERQELIKVFMKAYPERKAQAKEDLAEAWDESLYPSNMSMQAKFCMGWRFATLGLHEDLKSHSEAAWDDAQKEAAAEMSELVPDVVNDLRATFHQTVQRFVHALSPADDGRKRRLYDTNVSSVLEFLELFGHKNICGDTDTAKLVEQAKKLVKGQDAEYIAYSCRKNDNFRDQMRAGFEAIASKAEELVEEDESRAVIL